MPSGSKPGEHRGGRAKGTPNKATQDVRDKLAALGCDPIEGMAKIAMDLANPPELRGKMFAELAGYIAPKRKAIEHEAGPGVAAGYVIIGEREAESAKAWLEQNAPST
jgi:hypothetical protein